ncbi:MAG: hypothetical protein AAF737_06445 [Pseudomonadota bacterium]
MLGSPKLRAFLRANVMLVGATVLSFLVLVTFSVGFLSDLIYFNDPRHQAEPLKPWMTPRYVALSYDLPRERVMELFELTEDVPQRRPRVGQIARTLDLTLAELTERVREAAAEERQKGD